MGSCGDRQGRGREDQTHGISSRERAVPWKLACLRLAYLINELWTMDTHCSCLNSTLDCGCKAGA